MICPLSKIGGMSASECDKENCVLWHKGSVPQNCALFCWLEMQTRYLYKLYTTEPEEDNDPQPQLKKPELKTNPEYIG